MIHNGNIGMLVTILRKKTIKILYLVVSKVFSGGNFTNDNFDPSILGAYRVQNHFHFTKDLTVVFLVQVVTTYTYKDIFELLMYFYQQLRISEIGLDIS